LSRVVALTLSIPCLVPAQEPAPDPAAPRVDSSGVPYALIEAAPSLGKVKAYNPNYGFGVVTLSAQVTLQRGDRVAARRDGVVICRGSVESVEATGTVVIQFSPFSPDPDSPTRVRLGDDLIPYPPPARSPAP